MNTNMSLEEMISEFIFIAQKSQIGRLSTYPRNGSIQQCRRATYSVQDLERYFAVNPYSLDCFHTWLKHPNRISAETFREACNVRA